MSQRTAISHRNYETRAAFDQNGDIQERTEDARTADYELTMPEGGIETVRCPFCSGGTGVLRVVEKNAEHVMLQCRRCVFPDGTGDWTRIRVTIAPDPERLRADAVAQQTERVARGDSGQAIKPLPQAKGH